MVQSNGLVLLFFCTINVASAQEINSDILKAEYILRFIRYIEWPEYKPLPSDTIYIGFYQSDVFMNTFTKVIEGREISGRKLNVIAIENFEQTLTCHVIFIKKRKLSDLPDILSKLNNQAILTISDSDGFGERGVIINFYTSGQKQRFEINYTTARRTGFTINSNLLKVARVIK